MEPSEESNSPEAMAETICLSIALLGGMMFSFRSSELSFCSSRRLRQYFRWRACCCLRSSSCLWQARRRLPILPQASPPRGDSRVLDSNGRDLPCDGRKPLPPSVAFQRIEGGAPYMYEPTHGTPQYTPDERWDSQLTYPLEGN